ncbi:MAG: hypothetical protein AB1894_01335 [Chloroflexota bacterium]
MDKPIDLVPLVCFKCSTPVPAEIEEVAWVCPQCGQGLSLHQEKGLAPLEVKYAANIPANSVGKPYWVAEGQVALQRESYGSAGRQDSEAHQFWSQPRRFYVPAFTCSLENLLNLGTRLLLQPPGLQEGPPAHFEPVTLPVDDVAPTAEFIVMAIEADRKDKLKKVEFSLKLGPVVLWILP